MNNEMKKRLRFWISVEPPTTTHNDLVTSVNKKTGKAFIRKSDKLHEVEASLEARIAPNRPEEQFHGACEISMCICYQADAKHPKGFKITKPDNDNLEKTIFDVLERLGFFEIGDQQIAINHTTRCYDDHPGIYVELREV